MKDIFESFFCELNKAGINYGLTGMTDEYPDVIESDVDIIIPKSEYNNYWIFIFSLEKIGIKFIQAISHEFTAHYCIVSMQKDIRNVFLKPDVCSDYYRNGNLFLSSKYLLDNKVFEERGFFVLAADKEFIYYLLKKIDKGDINETQFMHLYKQWIINKDECTIALKKIFNINNVSIISDSFNSCNILLLKKNICILKDNIHSSIQFNIKDRLSKYLHIIYRVLHPTGLVIAIMGPDGCGKTTVINGVKKTIGQLFRRTKQYHLFPKESNNSIVIDEPHKLKPRSYIGSIIKLIYFSLIYIVGNFSKILPCRIRSTLIIFDRYYHDILVDPIRYRYKGSSFMLRICEKFIPKPDIWILLDAPTDVIQHRKSEVTSEETTRQMLEYNCLFRSLNNSYIINANQDSEQVILDVENAIINFMKNKTRNRYKK